MKTKASITVEASLVCPLFVFAAVALMGLIRWFAYAEDVQSKLSEKMMLMQILEKSEEDSEIYLEEKYEYGALNITQNVVGRAYIGVTTLDSGKEDEIVYITPNGDVYHLDNTCTYIKSDIYRVDCDDIESFRNYSGGKYYPCEKCVYGNKDNAVYITNYGNRYHEDIACKSINKNYIAIYRNDVKDRRSCSKCGGGN